MNIPALLDRLGGISLDRLEMPPAPGTATVADVVTAGKPVCELIEGTLIRRPPDFFVSEPQKKLAFCVCRVMDTQ